MADRIVVRGAREHNLENIDVTIPRDQLGPLRPKPDCSWIRDAVLSSCRSATGFIELSFAGGPRSPQVRPERRRRRVGCRAPQVRENDRGAGHVVESLPKVTAPRDGIAK